MGHGCEIPEEGLGRVVKRVLSYADLTTGGGLMVANDERVYGLLIERFVSCTGKKV
jgi:hypothetical protein